MKDLLLIDSLAGSIYNRERFELWRGAGVDCAHVTLAVWENARETLSVIGQWNRLFNDNPDLIALARTGEDIEAIRSSGRTAVVFGFQNAARGLGRSRWNVLRTVTAPLASGANERLDGNATLEWAKTTVQWNPCFWLRILPSIGIDSSVRYSSSPATRTIRLPLPPSAGSNTNVWSSAGTATAPNSRKRGAKLRRPVGRCIFMDLDWWLRQSRTDRGGSDTAEPHCTRRGKKGTTEDAEYTEGFRICSWSFASH